MVQIDKDKLYQELDKMTEHDIKARLAGSVYGEEKAKLVELYLHQKESDRAKADQSEQISIARSVKDAAWAAVATAKQAKVVSKIALGVAVIAVLITLFKG